MYTDLYTMLVSTLKKSFVTANIEFFCFGVWDAEKGWFLKNTYNLKELRGGGF